MKTNYSIIKNESLLDEFIDWLPDTTDNQQYYVTLFARKKYLPGHPALVHDKTAIARFLSQKDLLKSKIRQRECVLGAYRGKDEIGIPQESLALYISSSPRDLTEASFNIISDFAKRLKNKEIFNPHSVLLNNIHTSSVKDKKVTVFDIDTQDESIIHEIIEQLGVTPTIIKTRGGYHIIITQDLFPKLPKNWYLIIKKHADVVGDSLIPVIGCTQGEYVPHFFSKHHLQSLSPVV